MLIVLQRIASQHALGQVGSFTLPNGQVLFALERQTAARIKPPEVEAGQKSYPCIPSGTYEVEMTFSPRFKKNLYLVQGVINRYGIRLHVANYPHELQGCIALGTAGLSTKNFCGVSNSRKAFDVFYNYTERKPFTLQILDAK